MPGNHRNGTPVYKRIQNAIRKRIESTELRPGDAVASERELARTHKVSLMTARHALAGLEREGVVERRRGAGTFVAAPKIHFNKLMSYSEHMSSRGLVQRSRVLVAKVIEDEAEVAARLGLPATSALVKIERLRETHYDGSRAGRNFALDRQTEPLVLPSEISGLDDLRAFLKYGNHVARFSFPFIALEEKHPAFIERNMDDLIVPPVPPESEPRDSYNNIAPEESKSCLGMQVE